MLDKNGERQLAYLVHVDEVNELPGYDRVESARIGGWRCIVPKDQFKPGSLGIYFEIDSLVDAENPAFAFMEKRNYRVKTQKMCKSISQGLLMAPEDFGWTTTKDPNTILDSVGNEHHLGDETRFLTTLLKVKYYEPEDNIRKAKSVDKYRVMASRNGKLFSHQPFRWLMRRTWGKKLLFVFFGKKRDKKKEWPAWVVKTDEERVENMSYILKDKSPWIATEKIDGTSTTFTMKREKHGKFSFYVCSRNVVFDKPDKKCFYDTNVYLEMAEKYKIEEVLKKILLEDETLDWVTLQGETYGEGIQKRDYHMKEHCFMGFNLIDSVHGRWNSSDASDWMMHFYGIPWVPILDENYILPDTIEELRAFVHSEGSRVDGSMKEGIVFRSQDGKQSFKCVDPEFIMKYHG